MSDQGIWWKLWCAAIEDSDLSIMPIGDFGRWAKFGAYTKKQGTNGTVNLIRPPDGIQHPLQAQFQVDSFDGILDVISRFHTCVMEPILKSSNDVPLNVPEGTNATVSHQVKWRNWVKYQGDCSTDRTRRFRAKHEGMEPSHETANVTAKKRREEKRREESLNTNTKTFAEPPETGVPAPVEKTAPARQKKPPKARTTHPETQAILKEFIDAYSANLHTPLVPSFARDQQILSDLITATSPADVRTRMKHFFENGTRRTRDTGNYTVPSFRYSFDELGVLIAQGDL